MRLGILLGFEDSLSDIVEIARQSEAAGAASVYTVEAGRSAVVAAAAVVDATTSITVGTYVVNAYAREPWLTGLVARDLDELSGGRFALGVGTGNVHLNDWYMGRDSRRPMAKMREYVRVVRDVVAAGTDTQVHVDGDHHRIHWRPSWEPTRDRVPVYLSASGPNMVRLAGEVSDGVGIGIMSSVEFVRDIVRVNASAAARDVGRDPGELSFPMATILSVNQDEELARKAASYAVCGLFHPVPHPYYDSQLRQLGFDEFADRAADLMPRGKTREAMDAVPDEVIDTMTIAGTPPQCAARLADYDGVADEVVALRTAQLGEPAGVAAHEDFFELASLTATP